MTMAVVTMAPAKPESNSEFVTLARVVKTQGRMGEVAAQLFTDFPERFAERKRLFAEMKDGSRETLQVEDAWTHKGMMVFKFAGVDDMSAAERLIGSELQIPVSERAELEPGAVYISDLKGCTVFDAGQAIGTVKEVEIGPGEAPTLVVAGKDREYLVPFAEAYLKNVDVAARLIEMELPDGLLEVDARLGQEKHGARKP